jgi:hypothetical protein
MSSESTKRPLKEDCVLTHHPQAFENTSTNVAAAQMRNSLTAVAETVDDPETKKASNSKIL